MDVFNQTTFRVAWLLGSVPPHKLSATLIVKGTFKLRPGAPCEPLPPEDQLELTGDTHVDEDFDMPLLYPSDFPPAKPLADVLLMGTCHVPNGGSQPYCRVELHVGGWSKSIAVIGDRCWKGGMLGRTMSEPVPFQAIPLSYERSFGGAGFARNPWGRGFAEETLPDGSRSWRLPNLEFIDKLIRDPSHRPDPAGFGPLPMKWPQRMSKAGTYDKAWLKEQWPNLPKDADWTIFNAAPSDQQIRGFLRGDERLVFVNLNAAHARYESALPGLRVRWFVDDEFDQRMRFREVGLQLDTMIADLDAERVVLLWRGVVDIRTKQMKEVGSHLIVAEPLAAPKTLAEQYLELLAQLRSEAAAEPKSSLPGIAWPKMPEPPSTAWVQGAEARLAAMESDMQSMLREQEQRRAELYAQMAGMGVEVPPAPRPLPVPEDPMAVACAAHDRLLKRHPEATTIFPPPKKEDFAFTPPGVPDVPSGMEVRSMPEAWTRERVLDRLRTGGNFEGEDLSGLDLSGSDLSKADLSGAVLTEASLAGSLLQGARLIGTLLSKADLTAADLTGAVLSGADLAGAKMERARMTGAQLQGSDLSGASMPGVDFTGIQGRGALFLDAEVTSAVFRGAALELAEFDGAAGAGADFTQANLTDASLAGFKAPQALFVDTTLIGIAGAGGDFTGAKFSRCAAQDSVWEEAQLEGADFRGADLSGANFEGALLRKACLIGSLARRGRFSEADLESADLSGADLFRATFEGARLFGTRLNGCNLYESEFYQTQIRNASFQLANLKGTKLA